MAERPVHTHFFSGSERRAESRKCGGGSAGVGWENLSSSLKFPRKSHNLCVCFKKILSGEEALNTHYLLVVIIRKTLDLRQVSHYL